MFTPDNGANHQIHQLPEWAVEGARVVIVRSQGEMSYVSAPYSIYKINARSIELSDGDLWARRTLDSDNTFHRNAGGTLERLVSEQQWRDSQQP